MRVCAGLCGLGGLIFLLRGEPQQAVVSYVIAIFIKVGVIDYEVKKP